MASQANARADVISIGSSSSDESDASYSPPPAQRKRQRTDEKDDRDTSAPRASRAGSRNPKRAKIDSGSSGASSPDASGSEDGEIDESGHHQAGGDEPPAPQAQHGPNQQPRFTRTDQGVPPPEGDSKDSHSPPDGISSQAIMPQEPNLFKHESLSLRLPTLSQRRDGSWPSRFKDWILLFCTSNADHASDLTPAIARAALFHYIDQASGLKRPKKKSAKLAVVQLDNSGALKHIVENWQNLAGAGEQVASSLEDTAHGVNVTRSTHPEHIAGSSNDNQDKVSAGAAIQNLERTGDSIGAEMPSSRPGTDPAGQGLSSNGVIVIRREKLPLGSDAVEQQRRYFPSASDPTSMCLLCGRQGHAATNCSDAACKFCGSLDHWHFTCPTRVRCGKCRQLGHGASHCVEKLALTKAEGLACSFCGASDHSEQDCTDVWRSFHPDATTVHSVVYISPSCARCGSGEHYAADCGQRRNYAGNPTWSLRNRNLYIDPNCGVVPIEDAGGLQRTAGVTREPEIKIRGHAARTTNVHYSESDDSDVEFLGGNAVKPRAPVGQIRVASNIQMPRAQTAARPAQPPLPAEPLPPMPGSHAPSYGYPPPPGVPSYGSQRPGGPPPSLPAKPPAPSRSYHQVPPPPPPPLHAQGAGGPSRQGDHGRASQGQRNGRDGGGRGRGGRAGGGFRGRGRGRGGRGR